MNQEQISWVCSVAYVRMCLAFSQKSGSERSSDRLLRSAGDSDTSLDGSGMEKDDGWLDQNPDIKLHLSDLNTEESISDDELEVRRKRHVHAVHVHSHTILTLTK